MIMGSQHLKGVIAMADLLKDLSLGMGKTVKQASEYTVGVEGRGGYPSSGVVCESGLVLSADHTVEREEEIEILMADGSRQSAKVKGRDPISEIAKRRKHQARISGDP
jgi:serine protease Do